MGIEVWSVYIILCSDQSYYTGISKDVTKRVANHNRGYAKSHCRYTWSRRPVVLVYVEEKGSRRQALCREFEIKQMSKRDKEQLVQSYQTKVGTVSQM